MKVNFKEKNFKGNHGKRHISIRGQEQQGITKHFQLETMQARRKGVMLYNSGRKKKWEVRVPYPLKISLKTGHEDFFCQTKATEF